MPTSILDPFTMIQPGPFITKYDDWILFTLLLFFFWSTAGLALKKRFGDSKHLRVLLTSVSLMLAVGTYYSIYRGWLHMSLQGLGLLGAFLILIMIFFILYGMNRQYGMKKPLALPLSFAIFYPCMFFLTPGIIHNIIDIHPALNGILLFLWIYSVYKSVKSFMANTQDAKHAEKDLKSIHFNNDNDMEIDREIKEDKAEKRNIKKKTEKLTKLEIKSIDDIDACLESMKRTIKNKGNSIDQDEINQLSSNLHQITKKENILNRGLQIIRNHVQAYNQIHKKDIPELEKRLKETQSKKKQQTIQEELKYQKTMINVLNFMNRYESKITEFNQSFNRLVYLAMQKLKGRYPNDALSYIDTAHNNLGSMKSIYQKQKAFEDYLIKLDKKMIKDLKREKAKE